MAFELSSIRGLIGEGFSLAWRSSNEAAALYLERIRAGEASHETFGALGLVRLANGDLPRAIEAFDRLSHRRRHSGANQSRRLLERWNRMVANSKIDARPISIEQSVRLRAVLEQLEAGAVALEQGLYEQARSGYQRAGDLEPGLPLAQFYLGVVALEQGDLDEAEQRLLGILEQDAGHAMAHEYLGLVYLRRREPELARQHLEQAKARGFDPTSVDRWLESTKHQLQNGSAK